MAQSIARKDLPESMPETEDRENHESDFRDKISYSCKYSPLIKI